MNDTPVLDTSAPLPEVLRGLWPDGPPEAELAFWASLTPAGRDDLANRIAAITAASEPGADFEGLARSLSMGRTGFYSLRKRWAEQRTLRAVARFASRTARRTAPKDDPALPESVPDADPVDGRSGPSAPTARRLERERTRNAARDPDELRRAFGREFVLDVSPVDLITVGSDGPEWLVCAFLIERSSGFVLSAAPGAAGSSPSLRRVVREGAERALELRMAVRSPALTVVLPDPRENEVVPAMLNRAHLAGLLGEAAVRWSEPRRFGSALVDAVGERIGDLALRRRADWRKPIPAKVVAKAAAPSSEEIELLLKVQVRRSNELLERRLRRLGLIGGGGDPTPLVALLDAAFPD